MKKYIAALVVSILVLIGVTAFLVFTIFNRIKEDKVDLMAKAREYRSQQHYAQAIQYYEQAIEKNPDTPQAYIEEAEIYLLKNRSDDAVKVLKKGIKAVVKNQDLNLALGKLYFEQDDFTNAQTYLNSYYNQNKTNQQVNYYLGRVAFRQSDYEKAKSFFEPLDKYKPAVFEMAVLNYDNPDVSLDFTNKAKALAGEVPELTQWEKDIQALQTGIKDKKTDPIIKTLKASALNHANRCEPAVSLLTAAIETQEKVTPYINARLFLGDCYYKLKSFDKAKEVLEKTFEMDKSVKEIRELLAVVYERLGNNDKSIEMLKGLVELDQQNVSYKKNLINKLVSHKKYEDALLYTNDLIKLENNADYLYQKAYILIVNMQKYQDGLDFISPLIKDNNTPRFLDLYGWAQHNTGNKSEGLKNINSALSADRKLSIAYYHRGMITKVDKKTKDQAKKDFYDAIDYDLTGEISQLANDEYNKLD